MAFEQGTSSSLDDLITQFESFASSNSWTQDEFSTSTDRLAMNNGGTYFQLDWSDSVDIGVHQSLSWTAATAPGAHPDDSGNGGNAAGERSMNGVGNGPFTSHAFFANTNSLYMALEYAPGQYRHFAAGNLTKNGDWTGGEFVCGTTWEGTQDTDANNVIHSVLMDGGCDNQTRSNTMHLEGMPNQDAASKWGIFAVSTGAGTDTAGENRENLSGGMRGGPYTKSLGHIPTSLTQGFNPLIRVPCFYLDTSLTPKRAHLLGYFPDIRVVNLSAFNAQDEFTVGTDTWKLYPMISRLTSGSEERSEFGGIAYLKT